MIKIKTSLFKKTRSSYSFTTSYKENGITKSASYNIEVKKESANNKKSTGLGAGAITGINIGSIAAIGLIGFGLYRFILRKKEIIKKILGI